MTGPSLLPSSLLPAPHSRRVIAGAAHCIHTYGFSTLGTDFLYETLLRVARLQPGGLVFWGLGKLWAPNLFPVPPARSPHTCLVKPSVLSDSRRVHELHGAFCAGADGRSHTSVPKGASALPGTVLGAGLAGTSPLLCSPWAFSAVCYSPVGVF